jgi:hypothetical protein
VSFVDTRKISDSLVGILSDNRVFPTEWRHMIPIFIVQQALPVVINAKLLADGINEKIQLYNIPIPDEVINIEEYQKEWYVDISGDGYPDVYNLKQPDVPTYTGSSNPDRPIWINGRLVNE